MGRKSKLKKQIKILIKQIQIVENKRIRSQAALVEAILTQTTPDDKDVDFFNTYTTEIHELRDKIHELQLVIDDIDNK